MGQYWWRGTLVQGARAAVPVAIGYAGIGFAAGVIGAQAGLSPAEVTLLSLILFAGSAQLTDETFSLATSLLPGAVPSAGWMIALNMTAYLAWTGGNLAGAVTGGAAGAIEWLGVDFALAAMFAALLMLQVSGPAARRLAMTIVAGLAAGTMIGLELWHPHPLNLLIATVVAATAGTFLFPAVPTEAIEEAT